MILATEADKAKRRAIELELLAKAKITKVSHTQSQPNRTFNSRKRNVKTKEKSE